MRRNQNPPKHKEGDKVTLPHKTRYGTTEVTGKVVETTTEKTVLEVKYTSGTLTGQKHLVEVAH